MKYNFDLNLDSFPKELTLLLILMKLNNAENSTEINRNFLIDINWNDFIQLSRHHRVYPYIYKQVRGMKGKVIIPENFMNMLNHDYQKNIFQMLHMSREMERVSRLFAENEIRSLCLKGPVLAADLYGDVSLRTSCDLDMIVPINALNKVESLLAEQGYVKDDYILTLLNDWKWRHHHITFSHPQKKIKLEIHWRLNPGPSKEPDFNDLWKRKRTSSITSYPTYFLGREDLFVFLIAHGARHGWSRLRWLQDIDQITKKELQWDKLKILLKRYQVYPIAGQALILTSGLLNTPIPKEMKDVIVGIRPRRIAEEALFYIKQMVNLHTEPIPDEVHKYHKRHLFSLMSFQQKVLFVLSFLYPYPEDAATLPLPKSLHFLYFPLRPILWLWRKTRKHAIS